MEVKPIGYFFLSWRPLNKKELELINNTYEKEKSDKKNREPTCYFA